LERIISSKREEEEKEKEKTDLETTRLERMRKEESFPTVLTPV
jgi:hypothetical protein